MRIQSGRLKGRRLAGPRRPRGGPRGTRPTTGLVRKALFDLLAPRIDGASFLDLYAGTGAVGLEAASRGAARAVLVEHDQQVLPSLRENIATARAALADRAPVITLLPRPARRVLRQLDGTGERFDIVFADPPYTFSAAAVGEMAAAVLAGGLLAPGGLFVLQHHRDLERDEAFRRLLDGDGPYTVRRRAYGSTHLALFSPAGGHPEQNNPAT